MTKPQTYYDPDSQGYMGLDEALSDQGLTTETSVVHYVMAKVDEWQTYLETNYLTQWEEYNRIWRGRWDASDQVRQAERSRIVTPATQQAVESSVSEVEEATFGQGKLFDLRDDIRDKNPEDMEPLKKALHQEFVKNRIRAACSEVLINAAVYGTGIAEIVVEDIEKRTMGTQDVMDGNMTAFGVFTEQAVAVTMRPILTKNFYIDPVATTVDTAHGCCIDEFVPSHQVIALQKSGVYRAEFLGTAAPDNDIEPDNELPVFPLEDRVRILKYFGLVPRYMIEVANMDEDEIAERNPEEDDSEDLVEAIVVIGNEGVLLKAEENPYMMQDRPIVTFQWDIIPGLFHGRGVVEKGYNPQKALDSEIRARIDSLALTVHPMMGMDATRIPRGSKPEVRAGKTILTNGNPKDVLMPFNFGTTNPISFDQANALQNMVQQATGAVDGATFASEMGSNNKTGATSMALGAVIKRQKRTLINFQDNFWIRFVEKAAWRYMQFDPEGFPVKDYNFIASSSLGIMAKEYEVSQLVQLLQTTSDKSPMYGSIVAAIVDNMNISNREELKKVLEQASQPDPKEQQRAEEAHALEMELKRGQVKYVHEQAFESHARGQYYEAQARSEPAKVEIDKIEAVTKNIHAGTGDDGVFTKRLKIADIRLKERGLNIQEADSIRQGKARDQLSE